MGKALRGISRSFILFLIIGLLTVTVAAHAATYTFTTLDDPKAGGKPGHRQGTLAVSINRSGQVVGYYLDASNIYHGFLYSGGHFTTLDDPKAGKTGYQGTLAGSINDSGQVVGYYVDASNIHHGFLYSGGHFTTFDDPKAAKTFGHGTQAASINDSGRIVGTYGTADGVTHGFIATPIVALGGN